MLFGSAVGVSSGALVIGLAFSGVIPNVCSSWELDRLGIGTHMAVKLGQPSSLDLEWEVSSHP